MNDEREYIGEGTQTRLGQPGRNAMASRAVESLNGRTLTASPLEQIEQRIFNAARVSQEIGHKLHQHADEVHGAMPCGAGKAGAERDMPQARLDRIFLALDFLDEQQSYMAEAAGRNTTLA